MPATFSCQLSRAVRISTGIVASLFAPALEHAQAVEQRQAQVEHHRVEGFVRAQVMRVAAVVGLVDDIARLLEPGAQLRAQQRIVLDQQHPHAAAPPAVHLRSPSRGSAFALDFEHLRGAASSSSLSNCPSACNSLIS